MHGEVTAVGRASLVWSFLSSPCLWVLRVDGMGRDQGEGKIGEYCLFPWVANGIRKARCLEDSPKGVWGEDFPQTFFVRTD